MAYKNLQLKKETRSKWEKEHRRELIDRASKWNKEHPKRVKEIHKKYDDHRRSK